MRVVSMLVLLAPLVAACGEPDVVRVPLSFPLMVSGSLGGVASGGSLPGAGREVSQSLDDQKVDPGDVDSVTVESLTLTHVSPVCQSLLGCDLAFIDSLVIRAEASGQPSATLGELGSPGAVRSADIPPAPVELVPYVTSDSMSLVGELTPSARPLEDVEMQLDAVLRVDLGIL